MEIEVLENIFEANEIIAQRNRERLDQHGIFMMNVMSSPGAGKTSLVLRTLEGLGEEFRVGVIEGDIASKVDAERVGEAGYKAVQINTGGSCHLEARQINSALSSLPLDELDVVIIENVGNLVCPAEFKLGEDLKVMLLSVPEGDDKPHKYPLMFTESDVLVVNKVDLLDYTDFDLQKLEQTVRKMNPDVRIFQVSCKEATGLEEWNSWLAKRIREKI